jgi:hypothetical protein
MSDIPPESKHRWFQFDLRALLVLVTLAAVAFWLFSSQPRWRLAREQADFEESLKLLKAGIKIRDAQKLLRWKTCTMAWSGTVFTRAREPITVNYYSWSNVCYLVCYIQPQLDLEAGCPRIEVYRLPPVPPEDDAKHQRPNPLVSYVWKSANLIYSGQPFDPRFRLIYSDPPPENAPENNDLPETGQP